LNIKYNFYYFAGSEIMSNTDKSIQRTNSQKKFQRFSFHTLRKGMNFVEVNGAQEESEKEEDIVARVLFFFLLKIQTKNKKIKKIKIKKTGRNKTKNFELIIYWRFRFISYNLQNQQFFWWKCSLCFINLYLFIF